MIKNIIFDFGKVLVDYDFRMIIDQFFEDIHQADAFARIVTSMDFLNKCDKEDVPFRQLIEELKAEHPEFASQAQLFYDRYCDFVIGQMPGMQELMIKLKQQGYKLYGLTNWCSRVHEVMPKYPIFQLLDGKIISSEEHLIKPDLAIFKRICDRYQLNPAECVFTDDKTVNVQAAEQLGMKGIVFRDAQQFEQELMPLLQPTLNPQVNKMTSFIVMEILAKAQEMEKKGQSIIHMEVGEPDFDVPQVAMQAGVEALQHKKTHYTSALGLYELRQEIANLYHREYGISLSPERVMVTSGSSPAILLLCLMLFDANSEVIISNPGYACYKNFILASGATPVNVMLKPENGFRYDIEDIKRAITPKTKAIFINSPMNPTGALLDADFMRQLAALNIPIISDEIYHGLVYEDQAHSILEFTDNAFVFNGFSKRYAMTGLRLGYLIAPQHYMPKLDMLHQNFALCAPSISQEMGVQVLRSKEAEEEVNRMRETYNQRRLYLLKRLREIGLPPVAEPKGAFYILVDARKYTQDSYRFAYEVLEKAHVGVTPGVDFGTAAEGFLRLSYANSLENLQEGMRRLEEFLQNTVTIE